MPEKAPRKKRTTPELLSTLSFVFWTSSALTLFAALILLFFTGEEGGKTDIAFYIEGVSAAFAVSLIISILLVIFCGKKLKEKILAASFLLMVIELIAVLALQYMGM